MTALTGRRNRYQPAWLRWDLLAGLTTAAVVVPQAVAYASLAGLPVEVGLYVATVPMVAYAIGRDVAAMFIESISAARALLRPIRRWTRTRSCSRSGWRT